MEWTLALRFVAFRCDRGERAMIRDRDPRTDRNHHAGESYVRSHLRSCCWRERARSKIPTRLAHRTPNKSRGVPTQTFSSESIIGAIGAAAMLSGGTTSGTGPVEAGRISGCSTRVAMSIAVKSNAPARK